MHLSHLAPLAFLAASLGAAPQEAAVATRFPDSTPLAEGLSPDGVAALDAHVAGLVERGEVVGAELLLIKNGKTVLHSAHGWRDREAKVPMEPGGVFCVRSMTKTLIGAAALRLAEQDVLDLDAPASRYLEEFAAPPHGAITVRHLLTHTSGLPMSHIVTRDPRTLVSVGEVAALGPRHPLNAAPGERFEYSDQGTDTLTAILEVAAGKPAADVVTEQILEPLGMTSSACLMAEDSPLRARVGAKYVGGRGAWTPFWSPADPPLFPCFLGSQGLYSTAEDYARFLELLMDKGRGPSGRLMKRRTVRRMLEPATDSIVSPTALPGATAKYGQLAILWMGEDNRGRPEVLAFGHNGSDGTHAWAFPEQDAMTFYFTQSRGTMTGLEIEEHLGELLLGVPFDPIQAAPPLEPFLGYYREDEDDQYRAIVRDGDGLALEVLGKGVAPLTYVGEDRWRLRPGTVLDFRRDEGGAIAGYSIGDHVEHRFTPGADLPSGAEIAAKVAAAHRLHALEGAGGVHMVSSISMKSIQEPGTATSSFLWPNLWRSDESVAGQEEHTAYDGASSWSASGTAAPAALEGQRALDTAFEGPWVRMGNWTKHFPHVETIQVLSNETRSLALVRCGDPEQPERTYWVDTETWRVVREDKFIEIPKAGRMGFRTVFDDHREVAGAVLPHRVRVRPANPLVGEILIEVTSSETGVELDAGLFRLEDLAR